MPLRKTGRRNPQDDKGLRPYVKRCPCGREFPVELNGRGQVTTRRYCDECRRLGTHGRAEHRRPPLPPNVPRCADCEAVVGLSYGGVSGVDARGLCPSCAEWADKRRERAAPPAPLLRPGHYYHDQRGRRVRWPVDPKGRTWGS